MALVILVCAVVGGSVATAMLYHVAGRSMPSFFDAMVWACVGAVLWNVSVMVTDDLVRTIFGRAKRWSASARDAG